LAEFCAAKAGDMAVANRFCRALGAERQDFAHGTVVSDEALLLSGRLSSKSEAIESSSKRASLIYLITQPQHNVRWVSSGSIATAIPRYRLH
jgi:hypothetical protein